MRELEIVACASGRAGLRTTAICSLRRHFSRDFIIVMKFVQMMGIAGGFKAAAEPQGFSLRCDFPTSAL